ncbi:MAG: septal ring lytic transglycosylase RlpA family protein [Alphaproteobacteria bacterium]|nr:septal ring lytic transglycosylase RlpA family protein [Alphaproteobacteria bacterium]
MYRTGFLLFLLSFLFACTYGRTDLGNGKYTQASAITGQGGVYKVGSPYKIMGTWYYPKENYSYSEAGVASWYGSDFHAKKTANGEKYDMNALTAAHRTLPLPSIVKVTNLENGRSLVLRVNDRGPYAKSRIIDVSKRASQLLGFHSQGITKVRVEVMEKESKALKQALIDKGSVSDRSLLKQARAAQKQKTEVAKVQNSKEVLQTYKKGSYFIQVGSYTQEEGAQNVASQLKTDSNIYYTNVNGNNYYRVRVGPFATQEEAEVSLVKLQAEGVYGAKIVTD